MPKTSFHIGTHHHSKTDGFSGSDISHIFHRAELLLNWYAVKTL